MLETDSDRPPDRSIRIGRLTGQGPLFQGGFAAVTPHGSTTFDFANDWALPPVPGELG
jgi:hypothetical protein